MATITIKKILRINWLPFFKAILEPKNPPVALQIDMGMATGQRITPLPMNKIKDPRLVERFTIFACALACKKSYPKMEINANTNKLHELSDAVTNLQSL